jgi:hypothetical protein
MFDVKHSAHPQRSIKDPRPKISALELRKYIVYTNNQEIATITEFKKMESTLRHSIPHIYFLC